MAKWYNAYLTESEQKHKQVSSKGITARRRKQQSQDISKSYSKSGVVNASDTYNTLKNAFQEQNNKKNKK